MANSGLNTYSCVHNVAILIKPMFQFSFLSQFSTPVITELTKWHKILRIDHIYIYIYIYIYIRQTIGGRLKILPPHKAQMDGLGWNTWNWARSLAGRRRGISTSIFRINEYHALISHLGAMRIIRASVQPDLLEDLLDITFLRASSLLSTFVLSLFHRSFPICLIVSSVRHRFPTSFG